MGDLETEKKIHEIFLAQVKGRRIAQKVGLGSHDGSKGHSLEDLFGISHNSNNKPDLFGYELKSQTKSKTTFGDWSADWYLFSPAKGRFTRSEFLKTFGSPNPKKKNRYSWSGNSFPKVGMWNNNGQKIIVTAGDCVEIRYSYDLDQREQKSSIIPLDLRLGEIVLAEWTKANLEKKVNSKFNQRGWFKVLLDDSGTCVSLAFGDAFSFQNWIIGVKEGEIFLDSGMYDGNRRPYQNWRAYNTYWDGLIVRRYD